MIERSIRGPRNLVLLLAVTALSFPAELRAADELTPEQQRLLKKAQTLNQQAFLQYQRGQYSQAVQLLGEVVRLSEQIYPKDKYPHGHPFSVTFLNNLGVALLAQREYGKALDCYQRALAMLESLYPKDKYPHGHRELARSLNSLGSLLHDRGEHGKALEYYQRAVAMCEALYPKDKYPHGHADLAISLYNLGSLLQDQGEYGKARDTYLRSQAMFESLYPKDKYPQGHHDLANSLNTLGGLLKSQGDYDKALEYYQRALAMREALYPKDKNPHGHPDLARSLNSVGSLLQDQGEYGKAMEYCQTAQAMRESLYPKDKYPHGHRDLAIGLDNLGVLSQAQGEYGKARGYFDRALAMGESLYPKDKYPHGHSDLAGSLNNLGGLLKTQGEYGKALEYYQRARAMFESLYPKDKYPHGHSDLARSLNNLGQLLLDQGEYGKARSYFERSQAMREALYPKARYPHGHRDLAIGLNNLGGLLQAQGEYGKAMEYCQLALAMREALYPKDKYPHGHRELAIGLDNLGVLFQAQGEYGKARDYFERALTMIESLYPKDKNPHGHPELARSLDNLGGLFHDQGEYGKALEYYQRSLAMYEGLNDVFLASASEAEGLNYLAKLPLTRDAYLSDCRYLPDIAESEYNHVWRDKAVLAKLLQRRQQALLLTDPAVRQLGDELAATRHQFASLLLAPPGRYPNHAQRVEQLAQRKEKLERDIARRLPAFERLQAMDRLTPRDLLAKLPPRCIFVDLLRYTFLEQDPKQPGAKGLKATMSYVAFVLRAGQPVRRLELGAAAPIEKALTAWRQELSEWRPGRPEGAAPATTLRKLLWNPLAEHIPADTEIVFLAPDSRLTALPWAALPGRKPGTVLLEDHAVAILPHGRLLLEQLMNPANAEPERGVVLAAGAVQYDRDPAPVSAPKTILALERGAEKGDKKLSWPYLAGTRTELEQVGVLAGKRDVRLRRGVEAGTAQLLRDLPEARWAHLATHGFFADAKFRSVLQVDEKDFARRLSTSGKVFERAGHGARNPLVLSGVVLAGADLDQPDGGILTAEAIAGLSLQKLDLVVLSACETGLGEVAGGEGVFGLQRAFHVAGTRTVVATLWQVDDTATAALMSLFYHKLWSQGKTPLAALREAQLELYHHPERIPKLAKLRGPDLEREVSRPAETPETPAKPAERAAVKLWAGFTLSGLGR